MNVIPRRVPESFSADARGRAWLVVLLTLMLSAPLGEAASNASTRAQSTGAAEVAAMAVLDAFMVAFNGRDLAAWEATYQFPHFRFADGRLTILEAPGMRSPTLFDQLAATGWHHSAWLSREVVQSGPDKVHIAVTFARYREDGSELARFESLYVVALEEGRWGIRGRSSFAP